MKVFWRSLAEVAELVYAYVSEAYGETLESSSLSWVTIKCQGDGMVDMTDLKSVAPKVRVGSTPIFGTNAFVVEFWLYTYV